MVDKNEKKPVENQPSEKKQDEAQNKKEYSKPAVTGEEKIAGVVYGTASW